MSTRRTNKSRNLVLLFYLNEVLLFFNLMQKEKLKFTLSVLNGNVNGEKVLTMQ